MARYEVVPTHIYGPAVICEGELIDNCPSPESAQRIADALNALAFDSDLQWAIPAMNRLSLDEAPRVMRALGRRCRKLEKKR